MSGKKIPEIMKNGRSISGSTFFASIQRGPKTVQSRPSPERNIIKISRTPRNRSGLLMENPCPTEIRNGNMTNETLEIISNSKISRATNISAGFTLW